MPEEKLVTPTVAARFLGVHPATLAKWRRDGLVKPARITAGGHARYLLSELREQVEKLQRRPD